jgi:hypothetical protein
MAIKHSICSNSAVLITSFARAHKNQLRDFFNTHACLHFQSLRAVGSLDHSRAHSITHIRSDLISEVRAADGLRRVG